MCYAVNHFALCAKNWQEDRLDAHSIYNTVKGVCGHIFNGMREGSEPQRMCPMCWKLVEVSPLLNRFSEQGDQIIACGKQLVGQAIDLEKENTRLSSEKNALLQQLEMLTLHAQNVSPVVRVIVQVSPPMQKAFVSRPCVDRTDRSFPGKCGTFFCVQPWQAIASADGSCRRMTFISEEKIFLSEITVKGYEGGRIEIALTSRNQIGFKNFLCSVGLISPTQQNFSGVFIAKTRKELHWVARFLKSHNDSGYCNLFPAQEFIFLRKLITDGEWKNPPLNKPEEALHYVEELSPTLSPALPH